MSLLLLTAIQDVTPDAIPPRWPPQPETLLVENATYEVLAVPQSSIALVTDSTLSVCLTSASLTKC